MAAEALRLGAGKLSTEEAQAIWVGMDAMAKALDRTGFRAALAVAKGSHKRGWMEG